MVRAVQKGEMENPSPEVAKAASSMSKPDVKKFAKTKHKGLPMKKESVFAGNYEGPLYAPHPDLIKERGDFWHPDEKEDAKLGGPGANQRARENRAGASKKPAAKKDYSKTTKPGESYMDYAKRKKAEASKSSSSKPKYSPEIQKRLDAAKAKKKEGILGKVKRKLGLKKEELSIDEGKNKGLWDNIHAKRKRGERPARPGEKDYPKTLKVEGTDTPVAAIKTNEFKTFKQFCEGAAWTKKSGQNSEGGLNEKGRKSYERENPGSDLKAPSKKVGNPRRASFCARMKGMRKRQKPSNNTGDDRLSKSLRAWNC